MHVDLVQELPIPYYSTSTWVKNLAHWVVVVIFHFCFSIPDSLNTETNTSLQMYSIYIGESVEVIENIKIERKSLNF